MKITESAVDNATDYLKAQPYMSILHLVMLLLIAAGAYYGVPDAIDRFEKMQTDARADFRAEAKEQRELFRESLKEIKDDCRNRGQGAGIAAGVGVSK